MSSTNFEDQLQFWFAQSPPPSMSFRWWKWPCSVSCADYFSRSPNADVIDGADAASNRYGTPATSS